MYSDPLIAYRIIPSGSQDPTNNTWARVSQTGQTTEYRKTVPESASAINTLKISHQKVGKGKDVRDRHLVRMEAPVVDADDVPTGKVAAAYIVIDLPLGTATLQGTSLWTHLVGLLLGGDISSAYAGDIDTFWVPLLGGQS